MMKERKDIYDSIFLRDLFDEMAATYGVVNLVASFGFSALWRKVLVDKLPVTSATDCCDLLSGMGELTPRLLKKYPSLETLCSVDFSSVMCEKIRENYHDILPSLLILKEDVLEYEFESESFDLIVSSFGLKTFNTDQQKKLAEKVVTMLRPGGVFGFIEISVPSNIFLRIPYLWYLRYCIPPIGALFLGNPDNYRMLSVYTEAFDNARYFYSCMESLGVEVEYIDHFFSCGTGVLGRKIG